MPSPTESDYSAVMSLLLSNGLEATLSDSKRKYIEKVNALLAAWEHVTNYIANTPETTQALIEWANEHTLELVLRGEWPKLAPATKTHLNVTLQRCASQLTKQQQHHAARRCQALIVLVQNPWGKPALDRILNGQLNPDHEEEEFCCQEKGELLKMRLKILCEDRCEDIAVNLAAACVRSLRRNDRLRSLSELGQVNYMVDVYIVLLYKLKRTHDIVAQLKLMDLKDGLEMMQRLSGEKPTKYGTARVWRNSSKAAELVAQYLVTTGMVRPLAEVGPATLEQILNSWALLHAKSKDVVASLPGIIRKLIEPAESAQHIYIFCGVLARHFGGVIKSLVVELYIRALTTDMNELENQKSKSNKEKVVETAQRLSQEFLKLADCVSDSVSIARECVLTAFSLHPTRACYDRIRDLAVACGKIQAEVKLEKEELPDEETTLTMEETLAEEAAKGSNEIEMKTTAVSQEGLVVVKGKRTETKDEMPIASEELRTKNDSMSQSCATDDKSKCHSQGNIVPVKSEEPSLEKVPAPTEPLDKVKEIKKECEEETTRTSTPNAESNQGALILIKGHAVTGSANYDERAVPQQVLDGDRLGISAQLCDDLAVVLSSQRYHVLTWWLDWKELSELCERYLENAEEMRNTNKELKYLNIDYSQFKDQPYEDDRDSMFYGIEKGYEQWDDSDFSESDMLHQSTDAKRGPSNVRRSLDESSDTDSENVGRKPGRPRKVPRLESSESEYDIRHRKRRQRFRKVLISSSESDTNTQDSQTDSLGSDGFKKGSKKIPKRRPCNGAKKVTKRRPRKTKLTVDSVSHFQLLVNENIRPSGVDGVSDNSNSDIMTLFSADMDENKRETIKGSAAFNAAQLIISEKRSDPEVIKSLRMFRPNSKKLVQINEKLSDAVVVVKTNNNNNNNNINNGVGKKKENSKPGLNTGNKPGSKGSNKFAPMLSTLNLNPKIALRRVDEIDKKLNIQQKKHKAVTAGDLSNEIRNIQKTITFTTNKNPLTGFQKQRALIRKPGQRKTPSKTLKTKLTNKLQELLTKSVPGMGSMEFSVPPRVRPTVQVVQVTRNISQSPNSTASGNTPPRNRSTIQLPGTPSSGGHDSGVGMSPAGQTPPPPTRSSSLQDVGEEANQPPDTSPGLVESTNTSTMDSNDGPRTVALAVLANQRITSNQSPKKSPSPSTNNTGEQQLVLCKPDGTYQLVSPGIVTGQRSILSLQNFEDGNIGFARQVPMASVTTADTKTSQPQTSRNAGLPKFQQAFGKTICTLSTESTTVPSSSTTDETPAAPAGAATNVQRAKLVAASNISKAVQTAGQNTSIANIPNLQVATGTTRQILNIVQSTANSSGANAAGQTLQLSGTPGVIYAHKIPGAAPGTQLISIPANLASNRQNVQVKLNIIRTPFRSAGGGAAAIQVLTSRLPQQQSQQQQQPQQTVRQADPLINSTMEMSNQVSSSTLEQLREFESVLEQVKERSTSSNQSSSTDATTTPQTQTQTAQSSTTTVKQSQQQQPAQQQVAVNTLTQQLLMSSQSPSTAVEFPNNGNASVAFQQQQQQQQQEVTYPQKVAVMYANQNNGSATPKVVNSSTPVVVVTSYCQPAASPALSVTSQSSSSPCVTPAPTPISSTGKTQPQSAPKTAKKAAPKAVKQQVNTQSAAKTPPIPKPQQKPQEDPETTQRIYAILGQYAEQLRNSPDLNNKPAPRRRSNPPTNPNQSSKRKKSSSSKSKTPSGQQTSEPSPSAEDMGRTMGSSEDSSGGGGIGTSSSTGNGSTMMHVQDSPSGFSVSEETLNNSNNNSQSAANDNATLGNVSETRTASATSDSNDSVETNVKRRNLIFAEPNTGQSRTVIVQESLQPTSVSEALAGKMTTGTAVLVSESTPQPPNRAKPKVTTSPVPALIPTITTTASSSLDTTTQYLVSGGPSSGSDSQESAASSSAIQNSAIESSSLDGTVKVENGVLCGNARLQEAWEPERKGSPDTPWRYIPTTNALGMEPLKVYSRDAENSETIHNSVLQIINKGQGIEMSSSGVFQTKKYYHTMNNSIDAFPKFPGGNKSLASKASAPPNNAHAQAEQENQQRLNERKQQMLERELRLQKSLSEECEDLGVDEPSTSDLFPEADLLFDTNHSPSFDHSSQEASCSQSLSGPTTLSSIKLYSGTGSFFKSLDSVSSDSRDTSPVVMATTAVVPPPEPTTSTTTTKKKAPVQRRAAKPKESQARKNKRSMDSMQLSDGLSPAKHMRLSLVGNLSQDEASNSNSDLSRLSPMENDSLKETSNQKTASRNGSKDREGTPSSSRSSFQSHVKLDLDADSSSATTANTTASSNVIVAPTVVSQRDGSGIVVANNISSAASSAEEDENLTLLDDSAASVRIASPLSPIAGPLLMTHRYTYANNKKRLTTVKQSRTSDLFSVDTRTNTMSWESPMSEQTRSSTDDEGEEVVDGDESSISESLSSSQLDNTETIGNGLQEVLRSVASVKVTPVDHATYSAKRKTAVNRKTTTNHKDSNVGVLNKSQDGKSGPAKKSKPAAAAAAATLSLTASETESSSPAPSADKLFDMANPSDDDTIMGGSSATLVETTITTTITAVAATEHCTTSSSSSSSAARRSSLRGHVKKGCACCNGSPERPVKTKKAPPVKPNQQQQEQQQQQYPQQQLSTTVVNSKVKKTTAKQQQQQQQHAKQLAKKR